MGPRIIQGFAMEPIPPDATLAINGTIITCMIEPQHLQIKQSVCIPETIHHQILPTCYDNVCQITSIDETSMSSSCQLPSSTVRG